MNARLMVWACRRVSRPFTAIRSPITTGVEILITAPNRWVAMRVCATARGPRGRGMLEVPVSVISRRKLTAASIASMLWLPRCRADHHDQSPAAVAMAIPTSPMPAITSDWIN